MSNIGAYGSQLGLSERLREWSKRLRGSTEFPWQGTGLIADLEAAAEGLDSNDPEGFFSHNPATGEKLQNIVLHAAYPLPIQPLPEVPQQEWDL